MADTTEKYNLAFIDNSGLFGVKPGPDNELPVSLGIGDTYTFDCNPLSQVEGLSGFSIELDQGVYQVDLLADFAYSGDGVTYSTYQGITDTNLAAISIDPNDPLYLRIRLTGLGVNQPTVIVRAWQLQGAIDKTATVHGRFDRYKFLSQIKTWIPFVLNDHVTYPVREEQRMRCKPAKPVVFFYNVIPTLAEGIDTHTYKQGVSFSIGVLAKKGYKGYEDTLLLIQAIFTRYEELRFNFSGTWEGTLWNAATMETFGITEVETTTPFEIIQDAGNACFTGYEMTVRVYWYFDIEKPKLG